MTMTTLEPCVTCPMADTPGVPCAAIVTGHEPFCSSADPRMREAVVRLSRELAGRPLPEVPASPPTLLERAGHLGKAVVAAVASGGKQVDDAERARRMAICGSCEHFDADGQKCRKCTCYMPLKTRLEAWHCPLDSPKW